MHMYSMQILDAYAHGINHVCLYCTKEIGKIKTQFETTLIVAYSLLKQILKNCMLWVSLIKWLALAEKFVLKCIRLAKINN